MKKLYKKVNQLGIEIKAVAEVGVWHIETSNVLDFINAGCRAQLFEADPNIVAELNEYFKGNRSVEIYPYAIYDKPGKIGLYRFRASTFVAELEKSPALINDKYHPKNDDMFYVEARLFSEFDDGKIDLLSIDVEGAEWQVLKHVKSRPLVISVETHGFRYRNPFRREISKWMKENNYKKWYRTESDTVYIKDNIKTGIYDRLLSALGKGNP